MWRSCFKCKYYLTELQLGLSVSTCELQVCAVSLFIRLPERTSCGFLKMVHNTYVVNASRNSSLALKMSFMYFFLSVFSLLQLYTEDSFIERTGSVTHRPQPVPFRNFDLRTALQLRATGLFVLERPRNI